MKKWFRSVWRIFGWKGEKLKGGGEGEGTINPGRAHYFTWQLGRRRTRKEKEEEEEGEQNLLALLAKKIGWECEEGEEEQDCSASSQHYVVGGGASKPQYSVRSTGCPSNFTQTNLNLPL